jgi:RNA polymerase-interacting CarD/CdnL/TRCF family regulator
MNTPNENELFQGDGWIREAGLQIDPELDDLPRWEDEGGKIANHIFDRGEATHAAEVDRSNLNGDQKMPVYKVGDTVVHSTFGSGKIVAIADKGLPDEPCFYYVIENSDQTLWVPIEEHGRSSLNLPVSPSDFQLLIDILRSRGEKLSKNPYQRRDQLEERMQKASAKDLCLVIRDLTHSPRRRKLSQSDIRVLKQAQSLLLNEWERSLGTTRERAKSEMESILNDRR